MNNINSWAFEKDNVNNWAYWDKAFTEDECEQIIKHCKQHKLNAAKINKENNLDLSYRDSNISFVGPENIEWVYDRLIGICENLNQRFFNFDLWGMAEGLQFTEYRAPKGKYNSHIDKIFDGRIRKLSMVVQLTDPKKYKGCDLELLTSDDPIKISRERGYLVLFPSYVLHRVAPIEKGTRHSLVSWITGKPFK